MIDMRPKRGGGPRWAHLKAPKVECTACWYTIHLWMSCLDFCHCSAMLPQRARSGCVLLPRSRATNWQYLHIYICLVMPASSLLASSATGSSIGTELCIRGLKHERAHQLNITVVHRCSFMYCSCVLPSFGTIGWLCKQDAVGDPQRNCLRFGHGNFSHASSSKMPIKWARDKTSTRLDMRRKLFGLFWRLTSFWPVIEKIRFKEI